VSYHHGGWALGGTVNSSMMTPLGVLLHSADMLSVVCFGGKYDNINNVNSVQLYSRSIV